MVGAGERMEEVLEFREMPVLRICRSGKDLKGLIDSSRKFSKGRDFVLLLNYDTSLVRRMLPAFINARLRTADGILRSRSAQMEMLLLAAGTMNIGKALKEHGAKDAGRFMAFATSGAAFRRFASENKIGVIRKIALKLDVDVAGDVALAEIVAD